MKITLKDENQKIVIERSAENFLEILELMEDSLHALGFSFKGNLKIVEDEE